METASSRQCTVQLRNGEFDELARVDVSVVLLICKKTVLISAQSEQLHQPCCVGCSSVLALYSFV